MRGLPGCGKSHKARRLAKPDGVVLETDEYFYTQVGNDVNSYDFSDELLKDAREWNLQRFRNAIVEGISPIVVDRGNGRNPETKEYAAFAVEQGYTIELAEPDSEWWQELRVLLKYKQFTMPILERFAEVLAAKTGQGHRVPAKTILQWMKGWKWDLTVDEILAVKVD